MQNLKEICNKGVALYEEERFDDAVDCYNKALELDPGCLFACVSKALSILKMGKPNEALQILEDFDVQEDDPLASWAFFKRATLLYELGKPNEAISYLDRVRHSDPDYADSRFNKAVILEQYYTTHKDISKIEECLHCYDEAVSSRSDHADAMYNKGLFLVKLQRPEEALESFKSAIKASPDFAEAYDSLGSVLNSMGRYKEAISYYRKAIRINPYFAVALYNMANTLYHLDNIEKARQTLIEAVMLDPALPDHADIISMLDTRLEFNQKIKGGTNSKHSDKINSNDYIRELIRTRDVLSRVAPIFSVIPIGDMDPGHVSTYGMVGRRSKCRLLYLDTKKDTLVAKLMSLLGCTGNALECCYYRYSDESDIEYFYKIDLNKSHLRMPIRVLEKINTHLRHMKFNPSDLPASKKAVKDALVALQSKVITTHVFGARVMTRKELLRDFDCLKDGYGLDIHDTGLERDYYPRPESRGFGGMPVHGAMELQDAEKKLYWDRLKRREPIPPDVWKFLEDARRFCFDSTNPIWKKEVRIAKSLAAAGLNDCNMEKEFQDSDTYCLT